MARFDVTPSPGGTGAHHRPWWETDIPDDPGPSAAVIDLSDTAESSETTPGLAPPPASPQAPETVTSRGSGLTGRGVLIFMTVPALIGCLVGFALQGATSIPPAAGYGLILGALVAAAKSSPRLGWFRGGLPPVAMLLVILVAGQLTILGSRPTVAREATMIMANLAATAPAQVIAMIGVAVVLFLRRRLRRRT